ncbi:glyoxylate/hydroxypyruvate reductase A [Fertoebacter nigrum]|uniref:Glyoxylate/hydroxypyruvate reductase A n=1 Tax=Fertoeibacter niger TaxID=2656921 RepID=A0A8X8H314_9RHOB|nr:glyoxylate/hydroxypyruvate reductase A [Fertoeibacter niger]NUB46678.1 glyoxylate/hydroxypyruvate reductase A [Fertoeibacter niger]
MPVNVFFAAGPEHWPDYRIPLQNALAATGVDAVLADRAEDPAAVDYIVYSPGGIIADFTPFTRCKAVLNLWAGVEKIVGNATLTQPLCRMVDPAMTESMVEWVVGHALRHHLGMDRDIRSPAPHWDQISPPIARERPVAMLGMGALGQACAQALAALNFPVTGWSRTAKEVPGIPCLHGEAGLEAVLRQAQIVVTLLPRTAETENLLDARRLGWLPRGAFIINPGRGPLIDDDALLAALDAGQIAHATLDVFRVEPLPPDHSFWAHSGVTVTPHVAASTKPVTAAGVVAENIRRAEAGEPLLYLVDRARGY